MGSGDDPVAPDQRLDATVPPRPAAPGVPPLDADTAAAVRAFLGRLKDRYVVKESILFGSRALAAHQPDTDADLAVVLAGPRGNRSETARDLAGIAFDVLMDTGVLVEALPLWEGEFDDPNQFSNPALIRIIRRQGLRL